MVCPQCKKPSAHRSHRSNLKDRALKLFQMVPYRCHACSARFYAFRAGETSDRLRTREEQNIMRLRRKLKWKRSKIQVAAFGVGFVVFLAILYLVIQQRVSTG